MNIWLKDDFYWDQWAHKGGETVGSLSDWHTYLLMMENDNGLKYVDSVVELPDIDDSDIFEVVDERKVQMFMLKFSKYVSGTWLH